MKIATITVRVLFGLIYGLTALAYFFNLMPPGEMEGPSLQFVTGLTVSGYFMPLLKGIELLCGIAFVAGKFTALATVVIFPITLNIVLFHAFLAPDGMIVPILLLAANVFLAFSYREKYQPILHI